MHCALSFIQKFHWIIIEWALRCYFSRKPFISKYLQRPSPIKHLKQLCTSISIKNNYQMLPSACCQVLQGGPACFGQEGIVCTWFAPVPGWAVVSCLPLHKHMGSQSLHSGGIQDSPEQSCSSVQAAVQLGCRLDCTTEIMCCMLFCLVLSC